MNTIINNLLDSKNYKESMQEVLRLFAQGNTSPLSVRDALKGYGIGVDDLHDESIDVILDYVNLILDDHIITKQEMDALRKLKMLLHIKEGDFIEAHKEKDIENILRREFELIYQDKNVDKDEAAMKVDLQELFGLSYDQFLLFEQEAVEYALKQGADVTNLDTFYRL